MELIAILSKAIVGGASSVVSDLAGEALKDSYAGIKTLIISRLGPTVLEEIEGDPSSEDATSDFQRSLETLDDETVVELTELVQQLVAAIEQQGPVSLPPGSLSIEDLEGMNVRLGKLQAEGSIRIANIIANQDIELSNIVAGSGTNNNTTTGPLGSEPTQSPRSEVSHLTAGGDVHVNIQMSGGETRALPISSRLREALHRQIEACRARDVKYRSPHLMAALIQLDGSFAHFCLNKAKPDFANTTTRWVENFISAQESVEAEREFQNVDLANDPFMLEACKVALREQSKDVDERHALLSFLKSTSGLQEKIRSTLGDEAYERLEHIAENRRPTVRGIARTDIDLFGE